MNIPPFTIRIRNEEDQDMDWMVQPDLVTFRQTLEVISQIVPSGTITAFEYEDEDGDRITVRSEDEMKTMFADYFQEMSDEDRARGLFPPLIIYPKLGKTAQKRNIHGLTIRTNKQSIPGNTDDSYTDSSHGSNHTSQHVEQAPSRQNPPTGIQEILSCGNITEDQLENVEPLGAGNGGRVYRTIHTPSGRTIAVKVIQLDISPEVQKQILCELEILYKCNSRSIISFYGAFFQENRISICTEYMDGGSLDKYMPVVEMVLGRMAVYILDGLIYMWQLKLLHRDIKPSNVLVNTQGEVKLCDFGVSTQLVKSIATTFVGTNVYMAPERIQGANYGIPAEVWSLGVALFELATGMLPFKSFSKDMKPFQLMKCIVEEVPVPLPSDHFSPDFVNFVAKCMLKDHARRLTANELMTHSFIHRHADCNIGVIAEWVRSHLLKSPPSTGTVS